MPLGIVSDEVFERELNSCSHEEIKRGRGTAKAVPEMIRELIAEETIGSDKTQKEIAKQFGVSSSSVSAYANGATSCATYNQPNEQLAAHNDKFRSAVIGNARSKLLEALEHITPEKLAGAKLRDVASVAKDMSSVIAHQEPRIITPLAGAQFIFHVPNQKKETDYNVIEVEK